MRILHHLALLSILVFHVNTHENDDENIKIVVLAPDVSEEIVRSIGERFFPDDEKEYVEIDTEKPKELVLSLQNAVKTHASASDSLHVVVFTPSNDSPLSYSDVDLLRLRSALESLRPARISFSAFVPRSDDNTWIRMIGSPFEAVEYADRSGFNSALTLRYYLQEDEGITPRLTVQRVFLQLGYYARTFFQDELHVCTPEQNERLSCCCDRVVSSVDSLHASFPLDSSTTAVALVPLERRHLLLSSTTTTTENVCVDDEPTTSAISMSKNCDDSTDYTEEHLVIGDVPRLDMETSTLTSKDIVSQGRPYVRLSLSLVSFKFLSSTFHTTPDT